MRQSFVSFALSLSFALLAAQAASAQQYSVADLGTLPGHSASTGWGIDGYGQVTGASAISPGSHFQHAFLYSNGEMSDLGTFPGGFTSVGYSITGGHGQGRKNGWGDDKWAAQAAEDIQITGSASGGDLDHAFLYSHGTMQDLGTLPDLQQGVNSYSAGFAINESGQVAGYSGVLHGVEHAFLYSDGKMSDLGTLPGGSVSGGYGINASGEVAGTSGIAGSSSRHAFLYSHGTMLDLGTLPGGTFSAAFAINDSGEIAGSADTADSGGLLHAFLYSHGRMLDLGTIPGQPSSEARAINRYGDVVGFTSSGHYTDYHAFLYSNGVMKDLNDLIPNGSGWSLQLALGINDRGQITGSGTINNQTHAFLLTPVGSNKAEDRRRGGTTGKSEAADWARAKHRDWGARLQLSSWK